MDIIVELELVHGDDELVWIAEATRLDAEQGVTVPVSWPDWSAKGAQLHIPAVIQGFVFVSTPEGVDLGAWIVPRRLVMLDDSPPSEDDGGLIVKEYASVAAVEGIAMYYAAVAFNDTGESDCEVLSNGNYNLNAIKGEPAENEVTPSCAGETFEDWAEEDFLGTHCDGPLDDRGLTLDWMCHRWA